jgi:hypothetical protein
MKHRWWIVEFMSDEHHATVVHRQVWAETIVEAAYLANEKLGNRVMGIRQKTTQPHAWRAGGSMLRVTKRSRVGEPVLRTRFRWRARRELRRYEEARAGFPSYRWEVVREGGRYLVVAMQNVAVPNGR